MRVFTRTELCERLGVCARIRHKTGGGFHRMVVKKNGDPPLIHTVRHDGYTIR